jgi:hypothetical protein
MVLPQLTLSFSHVQFCVPVCSGVFAMLPDVDRVPRVFKVGVMMHVTTLDLEQACFTKCTTTPVHFSSAAAAAAVPPDPALPPQGRNRSHQAHPGTLLQVRVVIVITFVTCVRCMLLRINAVSICAV